ncbi:MAG: ADP-ribosylglycohydrolase family protein, partial [Planctomycetota bacterium]|nr:ADP-ribosylglycohydrolase family protein [Planctomycetota bacterium]
MPLTPDHFAGCLIGQCVGDAIGMPVEGQPRMIASMWVDDFRFDGVRLFEELPIPAGQYTDDSQLARELAISCVECRGFDPADYARRIARIFEEHRVVGRGKATTRAAERLIAGAHWETAGEPSPAAGNGTAMRAAPVGLLFARDHAALARAAHLQGYCTHQDARCSAGSVAIAMAAALAMTEATIEPVRFCERIAAAMDPYDRSFANLVRSLPPILGAGMDEALQQIAPAGLDEQDLETQPYDWSEISPFVIPSVLWSLTAFLSEPDDFLESIYLAIEPGGDVDTTAAMTGAIS